MALTVWLWFLLCLPGGSQWSCKSWFPVWKHRSLLDNIRQDKRWRAWDFWINEPGGKKNRLLLCRLAFWVPYRVPHLPVSQAIHHRIPAEGGNTDDDSFRFITVATEASHVIMCNIFSNQPSLWSCPADPLSIADIVDRSLRCRVLCETVSRCLSTLQTLYWLTRAAPVIYKSAANVGNETCSSVETITNSNR